MEEVARITKALSKLKINCSTVEFFIFGSVIDGSSPYSDIDLLVVYDKRKELEHVRNFIRQMDFKCPLDVIYMSPAEERETKFIQRQRCVKIFLH